MKRAVLALFLVLSFSLVATVRFNGWTAKADYYGSFTIYACNDTKTISAYPDWQSGYNQNPLQVGNDSTVPNESDGWFKFNVSDNYIGAINITSATVSFYCTQIDYGTAAGYNIYSIDPLNETWTDTTITWNNQPTLYGYAECLNFAYVNTAPQWYIWNLKTNTSGTGTVALQDCYDNNQTKSYALKTQPIDTYFMSEWKSREDSTYKPKLTVYYSISGGGEGSEPTTPAPSLNAASFHTLIFYPTMDVLVNSASPTTNYEGDLVDQIYSNNGTGNLDYCLFKFNFSYPDLVDYENNNGSFLLKDYGFNVTLLQFHHYSTFTLRGYEPFDTIKGIYRANETMWNSSTVTWDTRPPYERPAFNNNSVLIDQTGDFSFNILEDADYVRYSLQNNYTTTYIHKVNQAWTYNGFADWRMTEWRLVAGNGYALSFSPPCVIMQGYIGDYQVSAAVPSYFTWVTLPIYFANAIMVTPTIAGLLASCLFYCVFMIPVAWLAKKNVWVLMMLNMALLLIFTVLTWMSPVIFIVMFLMSILFMGVKLKRGLGV